MPMKVEAAIVTQKRNSAVFNTDSVNINGKVFARDVIKNGYKGSGIINGNVYFALTSSSIEGFADAAVVALNERAEKFPVARDPRSVFSGYFEDCRSALLKMDKNENDLLAQCFYASGRRAVLVSNSQTAMYLSRNNTLEEAVTEKVEDTVADFGCSIYPDICVGDIFLLVSPGVSDVLTKKDIDDILRVSDGSVKRIVSLITKVALSREGEAAVSVIAVKILETAIEEDIIPVGFAQKFEENKEHTENAEKTSAEEEITDGDEVNSSKTQAKVLSEKENNEHTQEKNDAPEKEEDAHAASETESTDLVEEEKTADDIAAAISVSAQEIFSGMAEDAEETKDAVDETADEEKAEPEKAVSVAEESSDDAVNTVNEQEEAAKKSLRAKIKLLIALSALLVLSIVLLVALVIVREFPLKTGAEGTTVAETTTVEETSEESTSEEETSEEETTEEETTEEEAATQAEETTRKPPVVSTPVVNTPTASRPSVSTTASQPSSTEVETTEVETTEAAVTEAETSAPASQETTSEKATEQSTDAPTEAATQEQTTEKNTEAPSTEQSATEKATDVFVG